MAFPRRVYQPPETRRPVPAQESPGEEKCLVARKRSPEVYWEDRKGVFLNLLLANNET